MFVAPPISVPPVVLAVVLLYHWYVSPTPAAVTEIGVNVPLIHTVCVAVLCAVIAVAGFTIIAPLTADVTVPHVPVTIT